MRLRMRISEGATDGHVTCACAPLEESGGACGLRLRAGYGALALADAHHAAPDRARRNGPAGVGPAHEPA